MKQNKKNVPTKLTKVLMEEYLPDVKVPMLKGELKKILLVEFFAKINYSA